MDRALFFVVSMLLRALPSSGPGAHTLRLLPLPRCSRRVGGERRSG